jgi:hypothetical protein
MAMPLGVAKNTTSHSIQRRILRVAEFQADRAAQTGKHVRDRLARLAARGDGGQFHARVSRQQAQQFHPRVTRTADDTRLDHDTPLAAKN